MNFGNDELIELKDRIETLITEEHNATIGARSREFFDQALQEMMIKRHRDAVVQQLTPILDPPA